MRQGVQMLKKTDFEQEKAPAAVLVGRITPSYLAQINEMLDPYEGSGIELRSDHGLLDTGLR